MNNPFVSIVCMTYNHEKYIKKTIESFREQTYQNVEFIIVDDCSRDNTYLVAFEASNGDGRIKIYRNATNIGPLANSKYSLSLAKGEFIGFCEGDDFFINPLRLIKQVHCLIENPLASMAFTASIDVDDNEQQVAFNGYGKIIKKFLLCKTVRIGGNMCSTSATLYRRAVTDSLPPAFFEFPVGDYPLQVIAASNGPIIYMPIIGSAYRRLSANSWSKEMIKPEKYLDNHIGTIKMLNYLYTYCGKRCPLSFEFAKSKYMYFLSINKGIGLREKITYLRSSSRYGQLFLATLILSPLFRLLNLVRRLFKRKLNKLKFYV